MFSRRIAMAALIAMLTSALTVAPAAAAKPTKPISPPVGERPLTPAEEVASARKIAAAEAYLASAEAQEEELVSLACFVPEATAVEATGGGGATDDVNPSADASADTSAGTSAGTDVTIQSDCVTPQGILGVEARDQTNGLYCGPAVGQVIANYSWALASGWNKYTQGRIAIWMSTDIKGGTNAPDMAYGLDRATVGSPRRPAIWSWVVTYLRDTDGDGAFGDQLHDYVRANVSGSKMPLAIPVKPYDSNSLNHLSSWAKPVASPGHWIAAYGWVGLWTGTDYARMYYTDSSKDEGGSTGKFWDPMRRVAALIMEHTGRLVW